MHDHDGLTAMEAGAAYALLRHGQDVQTEELLAGLSGFPQQLDIHVHLADEEPTEAVNNLEFVDDADILDDWDDYIGQEPLKTLMQVTIASAKTRGKRAPHMLFASGYPGVGKTTLARLVAKAMDVPIIELVPPFGIQTLVDAALKLPDKGILFLDEVHKLADSGKRGAEILLKVLEEGVAFLPTGETVVLPDITIIGATTDRDKLPEPVVDRFKRKPYFQAYSEEELARIAIVFAFKHQAQGFVDNRLAAHIALACRGTPRIAEEFIEAALDLGTVLKQPPTPEALLDFLEVEPDGMTRTHIHYVTALYQYYAREDQDGELEYIAGEATMMQMLRETKPGIGRIERFLVERGLIDRTPRGRRLTDEGIARAQEWIEAGKGVSEV